MPTFIAAAALLLLLGTADAASVGASRTDPRTSPCGRFTGSARAQCQKGLATSGAAADSPSKNRRRKVTYGGSGELSGPPPASAAKGAPPSLGAEPATGAAALSGGMADCQKLKSPVEQALCMKKLASGTGAQAAAGAQSAAGAPNASGAAAGATGAAAATGAGSFAPVGTFASPKGGAPAKPGGDSSSQGSDASAVGGYVPPQETAQESGDPNRYRLSVPETDSGHRVR